jgi:uncharacterized membrane protein YvlD (DUF360 family)
MEALRRQLQRLIAFYGLQVQLLWTWRAGRIAMLRRGLISFVIAFVAFVAAVWVTPGIEVTGPLAIALAVVGIAALNVLVRPVLLALVEPVSVFAVGILSLVFQVVGFLALGSLVPGLQIRDFWAAFFGSWVFAIAHTLLSFFIALDPDQSYFGLVIRQMVRRWSDAITSDRPGVVIVQIDGLSHPVLAHEVRAGRVPMMSRWIRSGQMRLAAWDVLLPSQTSASQAGILHGNNDGIPAFRWWERATQRLLVSNNPRDAMEIQRRVSNGEGLLSADGASIGNLFTGDAVRSYVTMASLGDRSHGVGQSRAFLAFFVSPHNYLNALVLSALEAAKEVVQARRQQQRGLEPSMYRGLPYPLIRAATNVLLRQLNTSLVIEEMYRGTPVIYVDYTDFDEIAHHSGPERPESLDSLDGIDRTLRTLEKAAADAPRPYRFVVLSDHGQSLGATFEQRYGKTLERVVHDAMGGSGSVVAATERAEEGGQLDAWLTEASRLAGAIGALSRVALGRRPMADATASSASATRSDGRGRAEVPELVVCASGNLGLIYFPRRRGRQTLEEIESSYPGLVQTLAAHPGIGCMLIRSRDRGGVIVGRNGRRVLDNGRVEGTDPLEPYGELAEESLRRLDGMTDCGDIVAISMFDEATGEVAAFEELIGSHGGLGGDQTRAFILFPAEWPLDRELVGAPELYRQMRRWLGDLGIVLGPRAEGSSGSGDSPAPGGPAGSADSTRPADSAAETNSTVAASTSSGPRRT